MGSLRVKIKLTVTVRPGSKVKYNEGKYKLTNYIDWVDKIESMVHVTISIKIISDMWRKITIYYKIYN